MKENKSKIITVIAIVVAIASLSWAIVSQCRVAHWKKQWSEVVIDNIALRQALFHLDR